MKGVMRALESRIGYAFTNRALLEQALTHVSLGDGRREHAVQSNERLEFLGDRVLGLLAAEYLMEAFTGVDEGGLAPRLNAIVSKKACAEVARRIDLGEAVRMAPSEESAGGRAKLSILGDACEALMAAIYLDGGLDAARVFFRRWWAQSMENLAAKPRDAKSHLQEWAAGKGIGVPHYTLTERSGPDHKPVFVVEVAVGDLDPASGEGRSKREAQSAAAAALLAREGVHVV